MSLMVGARRGQFINLALSAALRGRRLLSSTSDEIPEEFLQKHLAPSGKTPSPLITNTRREVLSLYRDVWRATRVFSWPNEQGVLWRDVLRLSARREFEAARLEKDPEMIARHVVVGRDAVRATLERFSEKREQLATDSTNDARGRP